MLLVNAALPVRGIDDLVKLARTTQGGLSFGSAGPGTAQHLNGELLKAALGIEMHHIPYKGIQPALNDLAGGHIALMSAPIPVALPLVQGGRVRMLGVTTKERVEAIPDVPSLAEIGVRGYDAPSWFMLVAPAKTPRAIVNKLACRPARAAGRGRRARGIHPAPRPDSGRLAAARRDQALRGNRDRPAGRYRQEGGAGRDRSRTGCVEDAGNHDRNVRTLMMKLLPRRTVVLMPLRCWLPQAPTEPPRKRPTTRTAP